MKIGVCKEEEKGREGGMDGWMEGREVGSDGWREGGR